MQGSGLCILGLHETCVLGHRHIALYVTSYRGEQSFMHGFMGLYIIVYAHYAFALYLDMSIALYVISYMGNHGLMHGFMGGMYHCLCSLYATALYLCIAWFLGPCGCVMC